MDRENNNVSMARLKGIKPVLMQKETYGKFKSKNYKR